MRDGSTGRQVILEKITLHGGRLNSRFSLEAVFHRSFSDFTTTEIDPPTLAGRSGSVSYGVAALSPGS